MVPAEDKGPTPIPPVDYYSFEELAEIYDAKEVAPQQWLLCTRGNSENCICLEQLPCLATDTCASFQDNIKEFEQALARTTEPTVDCQHGSTGACGNFQYFQFSGDNNRREMRWYDSAGEQVGQRNATDYPAYCHGAAKTLYQGKIPKCAASQQTRHICGDNWSHGLSPLQSLGI